MSRLRTGSLGDLYSGRVRGPRRPFISKKDTLSMPFGIRSLVCAIVASAAFVVALPATSMADVMPEVQVDVQDKKLGAHSGIVITSFFDYNWNAAQTDLLWDEAVKHVVVDLPRGMVGNPNAIPYEERCDPIVFETGTCPPESMVGEIFVQLETVGTLSDYLITGWDETSEGGMVNAGGELALLKTDPEVPATIGMKVATGVSGFNPEWQRIKIEPDTNGDLQLRTTTVNPIVHEQPLSGFPENNNLKVRMMEITIYGGLANGKSFMTNPTACEPWTSNLWAQAWNLNENADSDPLGTGVNEYVKATPSVTMPDCSNQSTIPFPATGKVAISSPDRNSSPAFDFQIDNPGVQADGQVSTAPRKVVTTIPAEMSIDVQQLGRTCQLDQFKADTCPATSRVGNVQIETPLIRAGLTGDVYLVKRDPKAGLPDLGLRVRGAITFTQLGSNKYTGAKFNQIETVFDNIPQVGFSKINFHIDGGPAGLLRTRACPTYNKQPAIASFSYTFTAWTGATHSSSTPLNMANCFGIQYFKPFGKCLHKKLPVHPNYQSRSRVKSVVLKVDGKRKKTARKSPFRFDVNIRKLKPGKHKFELKATYDDGTVSRKKVNFSRCR